MMVRAAALMVLIVSAPTIARGASTDQFDLVCVGTEQNGLSGTPSPHQAHYRIDLATGRWCEDTCERAHQLQSVTPDVIVFERTKPAAPLWADISHEVSRTAGTVRLFATTRGGYLQKFDGKCEPAPFSGMPTAKF